MCLAIDGKTFCKVLSEAPLYEGETLERVEHNTEENKRPYTKEVAELLAKTCGLPFAVYYDRLARIRGENIRRQIRYSGRSLVEKSGPFFVFPEECQAYIDGTLHAMPVIPCITSEGQAAAEVALKECRFARFCRRIDDGITKIDFNAYPEREEWAPRVVQELKTKRELTRYSRHLLSHNIAPPTEMFYPAGQLERLLSRYANWFRERGWQPPPGFIRLFLSPNEEKELQAHLAAYDALKRRKPKGKRSLDFHGSRRTWHNERTSLLTQWREWKWAFKKRHLQAIEQACSSGTPAPASNESVRPAA